MTAVPAGSKAADIRSVEAIEYRRAAYISAAMATTTTTTEPPTTTTSTTTTTQPATTTTEAPAPPATDVSVASVASGSSGSVEDAIARWFGDIYQQAWNVSGCESGHDPSAVSPGGGNYGLFQINTVHADAFEQVTGQPYYNGALNAYYNAQYARHLYDESGGWGPWSCRYAAYR